jgi:hypothetical protein
MEWALVLPVLGGLVAAAGGFFLLRAARHASRPAGAELGLNPLYTERAGGRFDTFNWTIPFVRVATFKDLVSISRLTHEFVLRRGEVVNIRRERHLISVDIRIQHVGPDIPSTLILWARHRRRLEAALRESLLPTGSTAGTSSS